MNKNLYAVILAGGSGTRFWPVSRRLNPKQFIDITGRGTLFQETLARVAPEVSGGNIFVVTNAAYRKAIEKQIARFKVPKKNVLLEPEGRNTAPAICWAAAHVHSVNPDAVMAVLPSDHLIQNHKKFLNILEEAIGLAGQGFLVTLGIVPTRPETGYGYLKTSTMKVDGKKIVKVARFTEKPNLSAAKRFIKQKNYFWNSGMFVWKTTVILDAFRQHLPEIYRWLVATERGPVSTDQAYIDKVWGGLPNVSIDYGILEKADNVAAVPAPGIDWSDLGSWESLTEVLDKDNHGNIFKGDVISVGCRDTLVWGGKKVIAPVGLNGVVIIDTPDALLVCRKDMSQQVKEVVSALNKNNRAES